ncbi:fungal-specific transcription factor domain-containing protein [Lipomyces orientalis]|uniref:Fungal-specific transcription factor domain-containing protein n=1 Tax=Lipomyces orientalis TaxID=1233043 RepID=A0ACC3TGT8_9ASCO
MYDMDVSEASTLGRGDFRTPDTVSSSIPGKSPQFTFVLEKGQAGIQSHAMRESWKQRHKAKQEKRFQQTPRRLLPSTVPATSGASHLKQKEGNIAGVPSQALTGMNHALAVLPQQYQHGQIYAANGTLSPRQKTAPNVCTVCRSQKKECDKNLPSCATCLNLNLSCDYTYISERHADNNVSSTNFLLFHVPVALEKLWIPGSLQPCQTNLQTRSLDSDHFFVGLVMTTIMEQKLDLNEIVAAHYRAIHPWLPVIHERNFRWRISQLRQNPHAETALLLLAMCMMRQTSASNKANDDMQSHLYHLFKYLFSFLQLVRSPSLELLQSGLLLSVFELGASLLNAASLSIGICARLGYALGVSVDPFHIDDLDFPEWVELEERRRVWLGIYMLDRFVHQVVTDFKAPYAVEELDNNTKLPVDDLLWERPPDRPVRELFQPTLFTPVETRLCYFAREIQAVRLLGQVQKLQNKSGSNLCLEEFDGPEKALILLLETLFAQTSGTWAVFCGANAIALTAILRLQQVRAECARRQIFSPSENNISLERSTVALKSFVGITCEICTRFNAAATGTVPLGAVIATAEAALAAVELNPSYDNYEPLKMCLMHSSKCWKLSEEYLRRLARREMSSADPHISSFQVLP